jgi:MFS family permease
MEDRRVTPLAGLISVVLFVVSVFIQESGDSPDDNASGAQIAAYFADNLERLAIAAIAWGLAVIALIWFLDGLRTHVLPASGQLARLTYGFGFGTALFALASAMPDVAGALASDNLDRNLTPGAAEVFNNLGDGFFIAAELMLGGFFLAVGLASVRARALPVWVGWISLVLAVVAVILPIGWAVLVFGLPLWVLLVSALLWLRREPSPAVSG